MPNLFWISEDMGEFTYRNPANQTFITQIPTLQWTHERWTHERAQQSVINPNPMEFKKDKITEGVRGLIIASKKTKKIS